MPFYASFMVEFRDGVPQWRKDVVLWRQLRNEIRKRIESGEYEPGHMLTQNDIAKEFGVAPNTVRKALADLRERGIIYTRIRLGSFVGPEPDDGDDE